MIQKTKDGSLSILLGTLGASLLGNMLARQQEAQKCQQ